MTFSPAVTRAALAQLQKLRAELRLSSDRVWRDIQERLDALARGAELSTYQITIRTQLAESIDSEIARLTDVLASPARARAFVADAQRIAGRIVPAGKREAFELFRRSASGAYGDAMTLFVRKELVGEANGLYRVVARKHLDGIDRVVQQAIRENDTVRGLTQKLTQEYAAHASKVAKGFGTGADLGPVGNAIRAANTEMNYAARLTEVEFGKRDFEESGDIVGIEYDVNFSCTSDTANCGEILGGPNGDGVWFYEDGPVPVPVRDTHIGCDCDTAGYIFRGDPQYEKRAA